MVSGQSAKRQGGFTAVTEASQGYHLVTVAVQGVAEKVQSTAEEVEQTDALPESTVGHRSGGG